MRDSNMPASRADLVLDGALATLDVLHTADESDDLLSGLIVEEMDFWWGAPLAATGAVKSCMCTNDPVTASALAAAGELA